MKDLNLFLIFFLGCSNLFSQTDPLTGSFFVAPQQSKPFQTVSPTDIIVDCNTDFFAINFDGEIQLWQLSNNIISGGDVVLTGPGTSLSFAGIPAPTFYSSLWPDPGLELYQNDGNWASVEPPLEFEISNIGGYGADQYLMETQNGSNKNIYHYDGSSKTLLFTADLDSTFLCTADIGVDSLGQGWVFVGTDHYVPTHLNVYNSNGLVESYHTNFHSLGAYGAFFLQGSLYIAFVGNPQFSNSIVQVDLVGDSALLNTIMPFEYLNYTDMAGCQKGGEVPTFIAIQSQEDIRLAPNPTTGIVQITSIKTPRKASVYSLDGQLIREYGQSTEMDLSVLPRGIYFIRIQIGNEIYTKRVAKH